MNVVGAQVGTTCPLDTSFVRVSCTTGNKVLSFVDRSYDMAGNLVTTTTLAHGATSASIDLDPSILKIHELTCDVGLPVLTQ